MVLLVVPVLNVACFFRSLWVEKAIGGRNAFPKRAFGCSDSSPSWIGIMQGGGCPGYDNDGVNSLPSVVARLNERYTQKYGFARLPLNL